MTKVGFSTSYYVKLLQRPVRAAVAAYGVRASCHGSTGLQDGQRNLYALRWPLTQT